jgi:magnesium chelatase subunit D
VDRVKNDKLYGKRVNSLNKKGKYIKSKFSNSSFEDVAIDATIRAAALRKGVGIKDFSKFKQGKIESFSKLKQKRFKNLSLSKYFRGKNFIKIKKEDIREKVRKHGIKAAITVVVDMSGSMISEERLSRIKLILQRIIANVHVNKDKLAVVGFRGKDSEIIIPNTKRPSSFLDNLLNISIGGTTPMAAGLDRALEISKKEVNKGEYIPMMLILTDGVTNVSLDKSSGKSSNKNIGNKVEKKGNLLRGSMKMNNKNLINNPITDVFAIGEEIAKNKIHTVIINFEKEENKGFSVNRELAFITNGRFYDLEKLSEVPDIEFDEGCSSNNSLFFDSFNSDLINFAFDEILAFERKNI